MNKRFTIGFLVDFFTDDYQAEILKGISSETEEQDVNLICFCGGMLNSPQTHHQPRNAVYDLVNKKIVDGLIILGSTIGNFVDIDILQSFYQSFSSIPIVSVGIDIRIDGIPKLLIDNAMGMRRIVEHLIIAHNCSRIAFIQGTEDSIEAGIRFYAYKEVLLKYSIPFDPELVCPGDFYFGSGEKAIKLLCDERKVQFDALIGSNDIMTLEAMRMLHKRGIQIPHEVAIAGFDDIEECRYISPPLTTVRQPLFKIGQESVKSIIKLLHNEYVEQIQYFPAEIILRRSCGCFEYRNYFILENQDKSTIQDTPLLDDKKEIINDFILQAITSSRSIKVSAEWARILGTTFVKAIKEDKVEIFLREFKRILYTSLNLGYEILEWQRIIRDIINKMWVLIASPVYAPFFTHLSGRIEEIIWEHKMEQLFVHKKQSNDLSRTLHVISIELITTFSIARLKNILDSTLPGLGIHHFYIVRYINEPDLSNKARVYIAYSNNYIIKLAPKKSICDKKDLLPDSCFKKTERYAFLVMALYFKEKQIGYVVYNISPLEGIIYENLTIQLSSTLMGAHLVQEIEETQREILYTLGDMLEARSFETGSHVKRVAEYSYLLGIKYGLREEDARLLKLASPMHDIGKLAIGDSILDKPGKLTDEEFEIVKAHTSIGFEIFRSSERELLKAAAIITHQHHEHYDGTGYPQGLKGEGIHIFGRITCLSDVFDALGNNRVYKKEWPLGQIIEYIQEQRGKIFDPKLVDLLFEYIDEILIIRASF